MYAFRFLVIKPYYGMSGTEFQMDSISYGLMTFVTMLIAVSGYVSNDYFDREIDLINKPGRPSVSGKIKDGSLLASASMVSIFCLAGMIYLSIRLNSVIPSIVLGFALFTTWWYSLVLKRSFVWGNLAVSFMTSCTLGMAWFFEWLLLKESKPGLYETATITAIAIGICFFAFLLSMMRELVKDLEDIDGDKAFGCRSIPIVMGISRSKMLIYIISILLYFSLIYCQLWLKNNNFLLVIIWLVLAVELPLLFFLIRLRSAETSLQFHKASSQLKRIMAGGIATMAVIWLNLRF